MKPNVAGAIAETRADQAWSTLIDRIQRGAITPEQLVAIADAMDSDDPAAAFRELDDVCLIHASVMCYAAIHYASARLMERLDEPE